MPALQWTATLDLGYLPRISLETLTIDSQWSGTPWSGQSEYLR